MKKEVQLDIHDGKHEFKAHSLFGMTKLKLVVDLNPFLLSTSKIT